MDIEQLDLKKENDELRLRNKELEISLKEYKKIIKQLKSFRLDMMEISKETDLYFEDIGNSIRSLGIIHK